MWHIIINDPQFALEGVTMLDVFKNLTREDLVDMKLK